MIVRTMGAAYPAVALIACVAAPAGATAVSPRQIQAADPTPTQSVIEQTPPQQPVAQQTPLPSPSDTTSADRAADHAQDGVGPTAAGQASQPATSSAGDVIVTGSRLPSTFKSPTPLTVETADQLQRLSPNSVGEALARLPAFVGSQVTSKGGTASTILGNAQALLNLRALGPSRTLVLFNGERLPPSNVLGSVDTNVIPQALLERVDVVTGGASSIYGSDAVAGVVNFVLNTRYEGLSLAVDGGETTYGDAQNVHVTVAAGHAMADGRLRTEGSFEYFHANGIDLPPTGRNWFDHAVGLTALPAGSATTMGLIPDVRFSQMALGGLITKLTPTAGKTLGTAANAALLYMQFGQGGNLQPFDRGTNTGAAFQTGGDGPSPVNGFSPRQQRIGGFGHVEFDATDNLTLYGEALYSRSKTEQLATYSYQQTARAFTIYADNPFIPAPVAALLAANNVASFTLGRFGSELPIENLGTTSLTRFAGGLRGKFSDLWSYDANVAHNRSLQDLAESDTINRNLYAAVDAVRNASGAIVCRSTLAGLDSGCVPINVLGTGTISPAGVGFVSGYDRGVTTDNQWTVSANVRGSFGDRFGFGAGPIALAVGGAYRRDVILRTVSPLSAIFTSCAGLRPSGCDSYNNVYGGYQTYNPGPLAARIEVTEGYAELGVPIVKDLPLVRSFDVDLAARVTNYSTSGVTWTWKIGPNWRVTDSLRLRATRSQDIRAPSANDLFSTVSSSSTSAAILYPNSTAGTGVTTVQLVAGNPLLKPEKAQTLTIGAVYEPSWLKSVDLSVDYYNIKISNAISASVAQSVVDQCSAGNQSFCQFITVNGNPVTTTTGIVPATAGVALALEPVNVAKVTTSGLDAELGFVTHLGGGTFKARALGNYVFTYSNSALIAPLGPKLIGAYGISPLQITSGGGIPRWTATLTQQYERSVGARDSILFGLTERLIAPGQINPNLTAAQLDPAQNHVPEVTYVDANLEYSFQVGRAKMAFYANVLNLFDKDPPVTPVATTFQTPTNFQIYDVLGRRFTLGIRAKF